MLWMKANSPPPCASCEASLLRTRSPRSCSTSLRSSAMYADASTSACIPSGSAERLTLIMPDTCHGK
jgi:hypothetical protein